MRKCILLLVVFCLCAGANVGLAAMSMGWWQEGAPDSTNERWDFSSGYVVASGSGYTADPEVVNNPQPNRVAATITPMFSGSWDGSSEITATDFIGVTLEIPNYENLSGYKEIWVDVGSSNIADDITVSLTPSNLSWSTTILDSGQSKFHIIITPNPQVEDISFTVYSASASSSVVLDYIDVDTICVPEPMTFVLLGLGVFALRRKDK